MTDRPPNSTTGGFLVKKLKKKIKIKNYPTSGGGGSWGERGAVCRTAPATPGMSKITFTVYNLLFTLDYCNFLSKYPKVKTNYVDYDN